IELEGELAGILALEDARTTKPATRAGLGSITMVAFVVICPYDPDACLHAEALQDFLQCSVVGRSK
ncbi:hypothetical protein, partial [Pacificibacter marinus]|uniref:hypothetical protein n=2 Tax=Pseudomonadota TaxID=1224 RepID=UPI001C06B678